MNTSLYERDFLLWAEDTVAKLRSHQFAQLDLDNLIEEVDSLGISQKKELLSRLTTLLEQLIKRQYVSIANDYNGWERTIREQRKEIELLLGQIPSLRRFWQEDMLIAWKSAVKLVSKEYPSVCFPERWEYSAEPEAILNLDFWQS
jgi:Domain of unknown function DUF29